MMVLKIHYMYSHLFPEDLGNLNDKHEGRFHKDFNFVERNYKRYLLGPSYFRCYKKIQEKSKRSSFLILKSISSKQKKEI